MTSNRKMLRVYIDGQPDEDYPDANYAYVHKKTKELTVLGPSVVHGGISTRDLVEYFTYPAGQWKSFAWVDYVAKQGKDSPSE